MTLLQSEQSSIGSVDELAEHGIKPLMVMADSRYTETQRDAAAVWRCAVQLPSSALASDLWLNDCDVDFDRLCARSQYRRRINQRSWRSAHLKLW
eukprot:SAG31_NODE_3825_length_3848_cov_1.551614_2_plen_95_part_00